MKYRIFLNHTPTPDQALSKDQAHHLLHVLRVKDGQDIEILTGDGHIYSACLAIPKKKTATLQSIEKICFHHKPTRHITLYIGITKLNTLDTILQKATEMGVSDIFPLICEYTPIKTSQLDDEKKLNHFEKIIESSLVQSRNPWKPKLHRAVSLTTIDANDLVVLDPYATTNMAPPPDNTARVSVAVGPEGGWSDAERHYFTSNNIPMRRLDTPILRAETAVTAALTIATLNPACEHSSTNF